MSSDEVFIIEGGHRLHGTVRISGAKNAALPLIASALLFDKRLMLSNVPRVNDVHTMLKLLEVIGSEHEWIDENTVSIEPDIKNQIAPYNIVEKMRASIYVMGPLVAKTGYAKVSFPGGCNFGPRPINYHLEGLKKLGVEIGIEHGFIVAKSNNLHGGKIIFEQKTVGGTIHLLITAALIEDEIMLQNVALEPEVIQVARFLEESGADIEGIGSDVLKIRGKNNLIPPTHTMIIPDRIEAGTFLVAALTTSSNIKIENVITEHISNTVEKLKDAGTLIKMDRNSVTVLPHNGDINSLTIETAPYPGFPTDMQAQFMAMLSLAKGTSIIREKIYPSRFHHAYELLRMGAQIEVREGEAVINGVEMLNGAVVNASDLRASASLVIAGLVAEGKTIVKNIYHLDRGYEKFEEKLKRLGAKIKRKKDI